MAAYNTENYILKQNSSKNYDRDLYGENRRPRVFLLISTFLIIAFRVTSIRYALQKRYATLTNLDETNLTRHIKLAFLISHAYSGFQYKIRWMKIKNWISKIKVVNVINFNEHENLLSGKLLQK